MNRLFALVVLFFLSLHINAQKELKLAKKFFGDYQGVIPEYVLPSSGGEVRVLETPIRLKIDEELVEMTIGKLELKGNYRILFESKGYFLLECTVEGKSLAERIMVFKRGKKISRDGLYPQPSAILYKQKSR